MEADKYLANALSNLRGAKIEIEAANWIEGKSVDEIRAEITRLYRVYRRQGGIENFERADALTILLNARVRLDAEFKAYRAKIEKEEGGD